MIMITVLLLLISPTFAFMVNGNNFCHLLERKKPQSDSDDDVHENFGLLDTSSVGGTGSLGIREDALANEVFINLLKLSSTSAPHR